MRPQKMSSLSLALCLALVTGLGYAVTPAHAGETTCTLRSSERVIEVFPAANVAPCEVRYQREPGQDAKVLWDAQRDRLYCETRARGLVSKLKQAGWRCSKPERPATAAPAPPPVVATPAPLPAVAAAPPSLPAVAAAPPTRAPHHVPRIDPAPLSTAEAKPPPRVFVPLTREQLLQDPKLRFYRDIVGLDALRKALRVVQVDLNDDGRDELFLRVEQSDTCGALFSCPWDLFQVNDEGALESLGVYGIAAWRTLATDNAGYPDLAVQAAATGDRYRIYRFALGLYRVDTGGVQAERLWDAGLEVGMGSDWLRVDRTEP